ncbi:MAG: SGNH/GDSL hydrolase family protein [Armatimonadetes bacterium]|nr:SGNH/GDSL hydrolase family protein [Armatimonadota bacterium]
MPQRTALILICALSAAVSAADLVPNGSFDEADAKGDIAGWTTDAAGMKGITFARDTEVKRNGTASARMTIVGADNPSWPAFVANVPVRPEQCYRVDLAIRTRDVERVAYVATDYLDAKGQRVTFSSSATISGTSTDWQAVSLAARIPQGAVTMSIRLILYGNGTAWFDDVQVVRDEAREAAYAKLQAPLPAELVTRGTVSAGDFARLHRVFQAATRGGEFTFGVIGGSITAGASATSVEARYSGYVLRWLSAHFPQAKWTLVNAGIGATGTNYGCLRAQRDLLSKAPDLVITEYAVNDGNTQEHAETYEGLLRQILTSPKQPAVVMLFMMANGGGNAQEWQSKLGKHYGLPMLSYRDMLWPEIEAKRMAWSDISPDSVHPNDVGQAYTGNLINTLLDRALASAPPTAAVAGALPAPLLTDVYQFAHLAEAVDLKPSANQGWALDNDQWAKGWKATQPGSTLEFEVTGEQVFLSYWRIRGPMGRARVTIDGQNPSVQEAWFDQTWGGYRHMIKLPTGAPGKHVVKLELLAERAAESAGNEFRLLCLGTAGK